MKKLIAILLGVSFLTGLYLVQSSNLSTAQIKKSNGIQVAPKVVTNKTKRFA